MADCVDLVVRVPRSRVREVRSALAQMLGVAAVDEFQDDATYTLEDVFPGMGAKDALRGARIKENMTQAALAEAIGVRRAHISEMEHGRRVIGKEMARRLSKALGVDYRVFL